MAAFDLHKKCDKGIGDDPCVKDKQCSVCDSFLDEQRELISTPSYRIRKECKAGILVSPKDVEVIAPIDSSDTAERTFSAPPQGPSQPSTSMFVTAEQFSLMNDKWAEQFARFEALLSRGNVFSTPKTTLNPVSSKLCYLTPLSLSRLPGPPVRWRPRQCRRLPVNLGKESQRS